VLIELLRQAPPWRKLQMVGQLNHTFLESFIQQLGCELGQVE